MPMRFLAETFTKMLVPPHSSGTISCSVSIWRTCSGFAPSLSILLTATMIGTPAALRVVDGLDRLRHDAVVGGDHEDDDVGDVRAAGTHGGERLVARGVDEGDLAAVLVDHRRADVLGDAAGLGRGDAGLADGVEQRRLAVVDVTHDGDDRRTRHEVLGLVLEDERRLFFGLDDVDVDDPGPRR